MSIPNGTIPTPHAIEQDRLLREAKREAIRQQLKAGRAPSLEDVAGAGYDTIRRTWVDEQPRPPVLIPPGCVAAAPSVDPPGTVKARWLSVEERLPPYDRLVLAIGRDAFTAGPLEVLGAALCYSDASGHHWATDGGKVEVTHWLDAPIPEGLL